MGIGTRGNTGLLVAGAAIAFAAAAKLLRQTRTKDAMRGKIVVITGGSRGLGLAIAREFGRGGARLVLAARNANELERAVSTLLEERVVASAGAVHTVVCDVTRTSDVERLVASTTDRFGRIDVLVNNAGIILVAPFVDQPDDAFEEAMRTNFFGALNCIRAVLPSMLAQGGGSIVNISSIGGKIAVPHMLPYVASKFALVGLSEGLHAELRSSGVRITTVCPGLMRTGSHLQAKVAGDAEKEYRWFALGATLPGASVAASAAARKIFRATCTGAAEITISPQAWLAARAVGLAPGASAIAASWVNDLLLPKPNGNRVAVDGGSLPQGRLGSLQDQSDRLQSKNNQR